MSQKVQKQKRPRTNSQNIVPQKGDYTSGSSSTGGGGGGGGNSRRNSKSFNQQSNNGSYGGTKVYSNSNTTAELQSLLNNLPSQSAPVSTSDNMKSAQYNGAPSKKRLNSSNSSNYVPQNTVRKGYAGAVISGGNQASMKETMTNSSVHATPGTEIVANDEESNRLNSTAAKRIDPAFLKLHGTASQVAVYRYNPTTRSWDKTDTAGCLLLYERKSAPKYGLVVMNRKNANNFIQCFGPDGQVDLHVPYLLLRAVEDVDKDASDAIHCIWFYDAQDCVSAANILHNMGLKFEGETGSLEGQKFGKPNASSKPGQLNGNTLFQILQQKRQSPAQPAMEKPVKNVLTAEELESQMLHESDNRSKIEERAEIVRNLLPTSTNGDAVSISPKAATGENLISRTANSSPRSSVLHQFFNLNVSEKPKDSKGNCNIDVVTKEMASITTSGTVNHSIGSQNQMRTVEQLERDMKKERSSSASTNAIQVELMQTLGISNMDSQDPPQNTTTPQDKLSCRSLLDNIVGKSVDETDPEDLRRALQVIEPSNQLILVTENIPGSSEARLTWRINKSSMKKENDSTFTTPTGEFLSASGTRCSSQLGLGVEAKYFDSVRQVDVKPTPLTKDQLSQALTYLLQNDSEFVTKIHDAYVKSLQQVYDVRNY